MKIVILRSQRSGDENYAEHDFLQTFDTRYAERVIGNLRGERRLRGARHQQDNDRFCTACGPDCTFCRNPYHRNYDKNIAGIIDFPAVLPYVLENPSDYVPEHIPGHDILLVINIHEQILLEILKKCKHLGTKGVVVPLEAPDWVSGATKASARKICEKDNIEISFPEPFCSFNPAGGGVLSAFRKHFHIGYPDVQLTIPEAENGRIAKAHVNVSAACGATYYIARWLVGRNVKDNLEIEVISKRLHTYPCTASMKWDNEIDDTPLHIAGQAHFRILSSVKEITHKNSSMIRSPLGQMVPKPIPMQENLKAIEKAKELIVNELRIHTVVTLDHFKKRVKTTPAALSSAMILLKKEGKIRIEGKKLFSVL